MAVMNFQALCDQFCDVTGSPRGELTPNEDGLLLFAAEQRDVGCNIVHAPDTNPDCAFVLIDFGHVPEELEARALRALMDINFTMMGNEAMPTFSTHPLFGNVTLQLTVPFATASGSGLLALTGPMVEVALKWREGHFLDEEARPVEMPFAADRAEAFA